jgi:catechol 2,3-dioxygenase-like lactoylglutathione lyase family enzyme
MATRKSRRAPLKKVRSPHSMKRASPGRLAPSRKKPSISLADHGKLSFNHAVVYVRDVARALRFYRDLLGFKLIEDFGHEGVLVYARLRAPGGDGTIALHQAGAGSSVSSDGVHLYFEVPDLDDFCRELQRKHFYITRLPTLMPWGWRHAYLNDPDGHEISLYWAGENRLKKTVMRTAREVAAT